MIKILLDSLLLSVQSIKWAERMRVPRFIFTADVWGNVFRIVGGSYTSYFFDILFIRVTQFFL